MRKPRILVETEFSKLNTGYACIADNFLRKLYESDKYILTEHARYCKESDPVHQQLIQQIPWRVIGNLPNNPQEEQIYNSAPQNEFGAWKFEYVCLDVTPDIVVSYDDFWMSQYIDQSPFRRMFKTVMMPTVDACFVANTPVNTEFSIKNIEDISIGDRVVSHDGSINTVKTLYSREYEDELITIQCTGPIVPITLTKNHPVLAIKKNLDKNVRHNTRHFYNQAEFIPSQDIEVGDYLVVPNNNTFKNIDHISIENYLDIDYGKEYGQLKILGKGSKYAHVIPNIIELDEDLAGLLGLFVAEGSLKDKQRGAQIDMRRSTEQEYLDFAQKVLYDKFGVKVNKFSRKFDCDSLSINSKILANFLKNSCGHKSTVKKIPDFILKSNRKIAISFLEKLFIGDGCDTHTFANNRLLEYGTNSRQLALQICKLLLQLGILCNINVSSGMFHIRISNRNGEKLSNIFGWDNDKFSFAKQEKCQSWIDEESGHALVRVYSVKRFKENQPINVYNLEIENKNSYCTGFAVHNCNQHPEWLDMYARTDAVFTYTQFSYDVLEKEAGGLIPLKAVTTPSIDTNVYKFIPNKKQHKSNFGIREDSIIIALCARNQRRKLYPDFAQAFVEFLNKACFKNTENIFLYWHTSYPDVGWDIPTLVKNNGLSHKVLFTYFCNDERCNHYFPSFYQDVSVVCPRCHQRSATLSNSQKGIDKPALANIYNLFDLYVQFVSNEALGIPTMEAAACGVPITGTYYTGTQELIDKLGGHPINPDKFFIESETGRKLCFPSIDELVSYIDEFVKLPDSIRSRMSFNTAELAKKHYGGWDKFTSRWMEVFDEISPAEPSQWLGPIDYVNVDGIQCPGYDKIPSEEQFVAWLLEQVLRRPEWINSYTGLKMLKELTWGRTTLSNLGFFANDMSMMGCKPQYSMLDRQMLLQMVVEMKKKSNHFEQMRWQHIQQGLIK